MLWMVLICSANPPFNCALEILLLTKLLA